MTLTCRNDYRQSLTIMTEIDAALASHNTKDNIKVTLLFDSTQSSKIDDDWPCLIMIFSDLHQPRIFLKAIIFLGFEDRENIVRLIAETCNRLAMAITEEVVTAKTLWEKTTAIRTDSLSMNLKIEQGIADA